MVLLPYRFTLFSNMYADLTLFFWVLLPYRFTLFSNTTSAIYMARRFYYLIDLHYSQTRLPALSLKHMFYYLIDLHYSQTDFLTLKRSIWFYYLIDLHYSQTVCLASSYFLSFTTLQIYTILKHTGRQRYFLQVLLPYRFTLFSNLFR